MQALVVLDFLIQRGSEQSVEVTREDLLGKLAGLEKFAFLSAEGRDHGINVRHRCFPFKATIDLQSFSGVCSAHDASTASQEAQ